MLRDHERASPERDQRHETHEQALLEEDPVERMGDLDVRVHDPDEADQDDQGKQLLNAHVNLDVGRNGMIVTPVEGVASVRLK